MNEQEKQAMNSNRSKKDIIKDARNAIKKALPSWTFSLTQPHHGSFHLALMSGPVEALLPNEAWRESGYAQLNHYSMMDKSRSKEERLHCNGAQLTPEAFDAIYKAVEITNAENWDDSDSMTDHVHVNYYLGVVVGKWDKSYQVKA